MKAWHKFSFSLFFIISAHTLDGVTSQQKKPQNSFTFKCCFSPYDNNVEHWQTHNAQRQKHRSLWHTETTAFCSFRTKIRSWLKLWNFYETKTCMDISCDPQQLQSKRNKNVHAAIHFTVAIEDGTQMYFFVC